MNVNGVQQLLSNMRSMADQAAGGTATEAPTSGGDFAGMLQSAVNRVNDLQKQAESAQQSFAVGEPGMDLQDVMMAMQKASLSFQTLVQVRNKLTTAYQEISNMQV
ncbi:MULTISPECIES: flagellar hook-basal body complex protein FliE [Leeia]|uniref:Flagellar hook-basal body complex protein FliE n=1 Tax=Leeia aquatica TaxID=2725557 RepID=A0A847S9H9_9NEIS|nr:flagellar hook-basal body complex protein FliE [Leeia aquatica]NLR75505.1 flagellar hook-basal body complex protein FliE [Leeia aquatica]